MGSSNDINGLRVLHASASGNTSVAVQRKVKKNARVSSSSTIQRKISLGSKSTLQLFHRTATNQKLKKAAPLFSFKKESTGTQRPRATIAAASREQANRLYNGPTVRMAGTWYALHDSPGPQAYSEGETWQNKFRKLPSVRIDVAKCKRDSLPPKAPGPGDYDIAHPAIGENGNAINFGDPGTRRRYPPRTPDLPRAQTPCSYAEHVSCLDHQEHQETSGRSLGTKLSTKQEEENTAPDSSASRSYRSKKRRKRRGGPSVFRRADYGWLTSCVEPKQWKPSLNLLDSNCRPSSADPSRARALTEKTAPRPVLRHGQRHNPSEYNPQRRDLPREKDMIPGPKYDRPPGAFGRTGGGGGTTAPSVSVLSLDRFPCGRLFQEEEVREREATPGPQAYDVVLGHRLEGAALQEMRSSLEAFTSWESLGVGTASDWPFAGNSTTNRGSDGDEDTVQEVGQGSPRVEGACGELDERGREELLEAMVTRRVFGRTRAPCSAGGSIQHYPDKSSTNDREAIRQGSQCSRLSPAAAEAIRRGVPCQGCLGVELNSAANSFVAASSSISDPNLFRRAQSVGLGVRFGDMPRQRSAPAFSIGRGARDITSRLLHDTSAETIYKEARLSRSGPGPSGAFPRAGDSLTRPRIPAARVVPPLRPCDQSSLAVAGGNIAAVLEPGTAAGDAKAKVEATEGAVVDGALGAQVKSGRPTSPSITMAGPRRSDSLFHERLRYNGKLFIRELPPAED